MKKKKKKYVKPKIKFEEIKEKVALQCGKCVAGNPVALGECIGVPRFS